jgi:YVTN family beta-propeller protein
VLKKIKVGDEPQSVALDPGNRFAVVANAAGSGISVVRIASAKYSGFKASVAGELKTGAEPWNVVTSPDGKRVFVANSGQDTITVINARRGVVIGHVNLRDSLCNDPDRERHFQPRGLAVSADNLRLYATRFLSFTKPGPGGGHGLDDGEEGAVCRLNIDTSAAHIGGYQPAKLITLAASETGFAIDTPGEGVPGDGVPDPSTAFPNQLQSIVIRDDRAYLPNIAASPESPLQFQNSTEAYVNVVGGVGGAAQSDLEFLNLHLGARDPEGEGAGEKKKLFFANPWAIASPPCTGRATPTRCLPAATFWSSSTWTWTAG